MPDGASDGSPSSTSGRTRSGWSSSPGPTSRALVEAHGRDPRGGAHRRGPRRGRRAAAEPMERALETIELYAHFCRATGVEDVQPVATSADPRRVQPRRVPRARARAHGARGARARARGGGALRLPGRGQLDDAGRRRRARPRRRLDAAHARRGPAGHRRALVAARRRAHDRALPARRDAPSASSSRRCARTWPSELAGGGRGSGAAGAWSAIGGTVRNLAAAAEIAADAARPSASRASRSRATRSTTSSRSWPSCRPAERARCRASRPRAAT